MRPMLLSPQAPAPSAASRASSWPATDDRKIIRLAPRRAAVRPRPAPARWDTVNHSPVASLERYERGCEGEDDYRHRMLANLAAAVIVAALIISGNWIVSSLAQTTQAGRNFAGTTQGASAPAPILRLDPTR